MRPRCKREKENERKVVIGDWANVVNHEEALPHRAVLVLLVCALSEKEDKTISETPVQKKNLKLKTERPNI